MRLGGNNFENGQVHFVVAKDVFYLASVDGISRDHGQRERVLGLTLHFALLLNEVGVFARTPIEVVNVWTTSPGDTSATLRLVLVENLGPFLGLSGRACHLGLLLKLEANCSVLLGHQVHYVGRHLVQVIKLQANLLDLLQLTSLEHALDQALAKLPINGQCKQV